MHSVSKQCCFFFLETFVFELCIKMLTCCAFSESLLIISLFYIVIYRWLGHWADSVMFEPQAGGGDQVVMDLPTDNVCCLSSALLSPSPVFLLVDFIFWSYPPCVFWLILLKYKVDYPNLAVQYASRRWLKIPSCICSKHWHVKFDMFADGNRSFGICFEKFSSQFLKR